MVAGHQNADGLPAAGHAVPNGTASNAAAGVSPMFPFPFFFPAPLPPFAPAAFGTLPFSAAPVPAPAAAPAQPDPNEIEELRRKVKDLTAQLAEAERELASERSDGRLEDARTAELQALVNLAREGQRLPEPSQRLKLSSISSPPGAEVPSESNIDGSALEAFNAGKVSDATNGLRPEPKGSNGTADQDATKAAEGSASDRNDTAGTGKQCTVENNNADASEGICKAIALQPRSTAVGPGEAEPCATQLSGQKRSFTQLRARCECGAAKPTYGRAGEELIEARWCVRCPQRPAFSINLIQALCECGATNNPVYGWPGGDPRAPKRARWCSKCPMRPLGAVNVKDRRCLCGRSRPCYGLPRENREEARWCDQCPQKAVDAIDLLKRSCECGNSNTPIYGHPEDMAPRWCNACPNKPDDAVDIVSIGCECGSGAAIYGPDGGTSREARWCADCPQRPSKAVVVFIVSKCECGMSRKPCFLRPGAEPRELPRWCGNCPGKPADAVSVKARRVCECGASTRPTYGMPNEKFANCRWCSSCPSKPNDAVRLNSRRCQCRLSGTPVFGLPCDPRNAARWCAQCPDRPMDAIDLRRCECGASDRPVWGMPDSQGEVTILRWCTACPGRPAEADQKAPSKRKGGKAEHHGDTELAEAKAGLDGASKAVNMDLAMDQSSPSKVGGTEIAFFGHMKDDTTMSSLRPPFAATCECGIGLAVFGPYNGRRKDAKWCEQCPTKPPRAAKLVLRWCQCGRSTPSYGMPGEASRLAQWCAKCRPEGAINIIARRCECKRTTPCLGLPGMAKRDGRWCPNCPSKPSNAVYLYKRYCACKKATTPKFAPWGSTSIRDAIWCSSCPDKPSDAVRVGGQKCQCGRAYPCFGLPGEPGKLARWCKACPDRDPNAIITKKRRCLCGASTTPCYRLPGEEKKLARWCAKCPDRPPEAINLQGSGRPPMM